MTEEQSNQEENIDFTSGGSVTRNISLSQAGVMAVRTAQANPARRRWVLRRRMLFDVLSEYEDEDSYTIVLSFRPEEDFEGTPGQERFKFSKTGRFEDREILSHPKSSRRFRIKRKTAVWGIIAISALIGFIILVLVMVNTYTWQNRRDGQFQEPTSVAPADASRPQALLPPIQQAHDGNRHSGDLVCLL